jgi:NitT/TauT family transport system substrate-binding protein
MAVSARSKGREMVEQRRGSGGYLSRREVLQIGGVGMGLLAAGPLLAACGDDSDEGGSSGGLTKMSDQLGWLKISQFDGFYAAQENGYYEDEGLEVEIRAGGPNIIASNVVASGQTTMGDDDNGTVLQAIAKGAPLVIYATIFQTSPFSVMSFPEDAIRTLEDFADKKVALSPAARPLVEPLLEKAGVDPGSVDFVPAGPDPSQLVNHQVQGYFGYSTAQGVSLEEQGIDIVTTPLEDLGLYSYANVLIATRDTIESERDLLVRHLRASIKGWEYAIDNPDEMGRLVATKYGPKGLKVDTEVAVNKAQAPLIENPDGVMRITEDKMQKVIGAYDAGGTLEEPVEVADAMTTEILDAAYGGKTRLLDA